MTIPPAEVLGISEEERKKLIKNIEKHQEEWEKSVSSEDKVLIENLLEKDETLDLNE